MMQKSQMSLIFHEICHGCFSFVFVIVYTMTSQGHLSQIETVNFEAWSSKYISRIIN